MKPIKVGLIAPSSVVPKVELNLGIRWLRESGALVKVHPQTKLRWMFFSGEDAERAAAITDFAMDSEVEVLWCARGGYGAGRLLPLLEEWTQRHSIPPRKLLVGYSDVTALHEYVRERWGWATLHGPMVANTRFTLLARQESRSLLEWVRQNPTPAFWENKPIKFFGPAPGKAIEAPMVGGNLSVWTSLLGTPFAGNTDGKFLFFEDVSETPSRIDRLMTQLEQSGSLKNCQGLILGDFVHCEDAAPQGLTQMPRKGSEKRALLEPRRGELHPARPTYAQKKIFDVLFGQMANHYGIPIAYGFPAGHGSKQAAFPLGATYRLDPKNGLSLLRWDWLK